jgi:hypothetical protein
VANLGDQFISEQLGPEITFTRGSCDGSPTRSVDPASGADITDSVVLCALLDENKDDLAATAGFEARSDELIGSDDVPYGGSRCTISGRPSDFIDVTVFADPALTIELASQAFENVSAVSELHEDAVYLATEDDVNATLFPIGDRVVKVESGVSWVSIPRDDLIQVALRIQQILTDVG